VYVGAELFVASSGDMVAMLSRSPARNHYSQSGDVSGEPAALQRPVAKRFKGLPSKMAMCGACFAQKQAAGEAA